MEIFQTNMYHSLHNGILTVLDKAGEEDECLWNFLEDIQFGLWDLFAYIAILKQQ